MPIKYRMYWTRETGCDAGTRFDLAALPAPAPERIAALTTESDREEHREISVHLPFLDKPEWRRRAEILRTLQFLREGDAIRGVWDVSMFALRERAAELVAWHPAWMRAAKDRHPDYFSAWQPVSVGLQKAMRRWVCEAYFRDPARYEDREMARPMLVYAASRACFGKPRTEFTFDVAAAETLPTAVRMIGRPLRELMAAAERRLDEAGRSTLARRYAPRWHQDVVDTTLKGPKKLLALFGDEGMLINAVIELGGSGSLSSVKPFTRATKAALRNMHGIDVRPLAMKALDEATRILEERREESAGQVAA